jgi:hypothetical protein
MAQLLAEGLGGCQLRDHGLLFSSSLSAGSESTLLSDLSRLVDSYHVAVFPCGVGVPPRLAAELLCFNFQACH